MRAEAQRVNTRDLLIERVEQCDATRGRLPNFIAVNYLAIADLFAVVDELNGV